MDQRFGPFGQPAVDDNLVTWEEVPMLLLHLLTE